MRVSKQELLELRQKFHNYLKGSYNSATKERRWDTFYGLPMPALILDLEDARKENEKLREALEKYGAHNSDCAVIVSAGVCSCGLEEAIAATEDGNGTC